MRTSIFFYWLLFTTKLINTSSADNSYNVEVRAEECARKGVVDNPVGVDNGDVG